MDDLCTDDEVKSMKDFFDYFNSAVDIAKKVTDGMSSSEKKQLKDYEDKNDVESERKLFLTLYNVSLNQWVLDFF